MLNCVTDPGHCPVSAPVVQASVNDHQMPPPLSSPHLDSLIQTQTLPLCNCRDHGTDKQGAMAILVINVDWEFQGSVHFIQK